MQRLHWFGTYLQHGKFIKGHREYYISYTKLFEYAF